MFDPSSNAGVCRVFFRKRKRFGALLGLAGIRCGVVAKLHIADKQKSGVLVYLTCKIFVRAGKKVLRGFSDRELFFGEIICSSFGYGT